VSSGKEWWTLAGIVAFAITVRMLHLHQMSVDLFFNAPIIDARTNVEEARFLAQRDWLGQPGPFWKPPLYPYLLAGQFALFGDGLWLPRVVQVFLDGANCYLVFAVGVRLFSRRVSMIAAAVFAASGPLIYFSGELVSATLAVSLCLSLIYVVLWARENGSVWRWLAVGAMLGFAALARPELLLLTPLLIALAYFDQPGEWKQRALYASAVGVAAALLVAPVTIRNGVIGKDAVVISANGGINLYVGNHRPYRGMVGVRPGPEWERLMREPRGRGITTRGSAHSAYYRDRALRIIADNPFAALGHSLKKGVLFVHGHELASNQDLYRARKKSVVLAATLWHIPGLYFPFGLLAPLGLIGLVLAFRTRHPSRILAGFLGTLLAVAMVFFVTARFRAPAVPVFILFAVFAADWMVTKAREKKWRATAPYVAGFIGLFVIINASFVFGSDRAAYHEEMRAEEHHYRGTVLFAVHKRYAEAIDELKAAAVLNPRRASTYFNLGQTYEAMNRPRELVDAMRLVLVTVETSPGERYFVSPAMKLMLRGLRVDPTLASEPFGRGVLCLAQRDWTCAVDSFREANDHVFGARAMYERARARLRRTDNTGARADLQAAAKSRPDDAATRLMLGLAHHRLGNSKEAKEHIDQFRALEWPQGTLYRRLAKPKRNPDPLLTEALKVILTYHPDEAAARDAVDATQSTQR